LQHLIIELAGLCQATHEQAGLFLIWIQAVFKGSHSPSFNRLEYESQQLRPPVGGRPFIPVAKVRGPLAALW